MNKGVSTKLLGFFERERLPADLLEGIDKKYAALLTDIDAARQSSNGAIVVGINGAQGTGKSTMASILKILLDERWGYRTAILSLDDLYYTKAEREARAKSVHPLLATRGVPGTHDVELGIQVITELKKLTQCESIPIPRFDKGCDDRAPESEWIIQNGTVDVILFEGWCVGAKAQSPAALRQPVNRLEKEQDPNGIWRKHVNDQLAGPYQRLFGLVDIIVMLLVPRFEDVLALRGLQEKKLIERQAKDSSETNAVMRTQEEIEHFVSHFERLTKHMLLHMPKQAKHIIRVDGERDLHC